MAWATKYRGEFKDVTYSGATQGLLWTAEIEEDGYGGAVSDMVMAGDPLTIEHLTGSDDLFLSPVKGSRATVNVWSTTQFQYTSLYSSENLKYRCSIYYGDAKTLYWRGYLTTEYSEPYDDTPYMVSITANDGLATLRDLAYDNDGTLYEGRATEALILARILTKIGFTGFKEACNVYDTRMDSDTTDSPFDQCYIDQDLFVYDDGTAWDCYTVLEEILKKYNAIIRQSRGEFWIFRPTEMNDTMYYRYFTAYDTKTADSYSPTKYVHRTAQSSTIKDFTGGILQIRPPLSQFTATQDYGNRDSWLDNYKFQADTYDNDTYLFDNWSRIGAAGKQRPVSYFLIKDEYEGVGFLNTSASVPDSSSLIYQQFGTYARQTSNTFRFSFDYRIVNPTASAVSNLHIVMLIADGTSSYYLAIDDENNCEWSSSYDIIDYTEATVPIGQGEWKNFSRAIPGLPIDGPYFIELFQANQGCYLLLKNIQIFCTSDVIISKKKRVDKWKRWVNIIPPFGFIYMFGGGRKTISEKINIDNEEIVERVYLSPDPATITAPTAKQDYALGDCEDTEIDNVVEQFKGSLAVLTSGSLTATATNFIIDNAASYVAGGVTATSSGNDIIFTATVPGVNFTGSTTITNASGTLDGTVVNTTANAAGTKQKETLDLIGGTGGDFNVIYGAANHITTFVTSLTATASAFVSDHAATFVTYGITVTASGTTIIFEEAVALGGFDQPIFYADPGGDMEGEWLSGPPEQVASVPPVARVDTVTLSGSSGTANILCDGVTELATFDTDTVYDYTRSWHTRGGTENKPIIELVADEIAAQSTREKHFIQANLRESSVTGPDVNVINNLQDTLNTYSGSTRVFAINRGTFDVKSRLWSIDLIELVGGSTEFDDYYTADSTLITADITSITVDNEEI